MRIKAWRSFITVLLSAVFILASSAVRAENDPETVAGFPVIKQNNEELAQYLIAIEWKELPIDTAKRGLIDEFAAADQDKCAFSLFNCDEIYVYNGSVCVACYHFSTYGSFYLFPDNGEFYIYDVRGCRFLCFNEKDGATALYKVDIDADRFHGSDLVWIGDITRYKKEREEDGSLSIVQGDYVLTNKGPTLIPLLSKRYDTLLYTGGSYKRTLYSSDARHTSLIIFLVVFSISTAGGIAMIILSAIAKKRKATIGQLFAGIKNRMKE